LTENNIKSFIRILTLTPTTMKKQLHYILLLALAVGLISSEAMAQSAPPSNLSGNSLRTWLKQNWFEGKHSQLGYNGARSAMYSYIDSQNGTVYCLYTGFNQPAANTTYLNPINAEHVVPQSWFGKSEPMRSDVHHLFPTHGSVNSSRSNYPFNEINDSNTDTWYGVNGSTYTTSSSIPSNKDDYSERDGSVFEPVEASKGNVARAIFYFYTMYPTQAGSINDIVSNGDLDVLYQWHLQDPVDGAEITRNNRAEERQGNRNPYIDYPDAVASAWGFTPPTGGGGGGGTTLSCSSAVSSFPYSESFESGLGAFTQGSGDDLDWTRDASGTPSGSTGPSSGAAGSYYMYVESSSPNYPSKTTYFNSPCFNLAGQTTADISFGYHMYGSNMGTLKLEATTDGSAWTSVWSQTGDKGNAWQTASVSLDSYAGQTVKLRFSGLTGSSYRSDMAIDNLEVSTGGSTGGGGGGSTGNTSVTLTLVLDNYPTETDWVLRTSDGSSTISSGNNYSAANSTVTKTFSLPAGCYKFDITDEYGDGICCSYGNGSYTLKAGTTTLASGGSYGSGETKNFCVGGASNRVGNFGNETVAKSIQLNNSLEMSIFPNPATDIATIRLNKYAKEDLTVKVLGLDGREIFSSTILKDAQNASLELDTRKFGKGLYIVQVSGESFKQVSKLMVK
jgi:hypothetical protein